MNRTILIILGIFLFGFSIATIIIGHGLEQREGLCVDGDGDINLEGIKCMKTYGTFYGDRTENNFLLIFLVMMGVIGLLLFISSILKILI
jgi:hypothetical protein